MSEKNIETILIDECVLNYLVYRHHLKNGGYDLLDLRLPETNPLGLGSSDRDIFNWAIEHQDRPAIFTQNVKDFRKLNASSNEKATVLKAPSLTCNLQTFHEALNLINTLPRSHYYSVAAAISNCSKN